MSFHRSPVYYSRHGYMWWVVALAALVVAGAAYLGWQVAVPAGGGAGACASEPCPRELIPFDVQTGESAKSIGARLEQQSLIRSQYWFEVWVWITQTEQRFVAGNYQLPRHVSLKNVVRLLTGAVRPTAEVSVRVIEGWTMQQVVDYLSDGGVVSADVFATAVSTPESVAALLQNLPRERFSGLPRGATLEGYLFPDTYRVYREGGAQQLATKMVGQFSTVVAELVPEIERSGRTVHEVVTLASIVEREVRTDRDRALAADIFWRRLAVGQALQADSTVNYITGKNLPAVSLSDTHLDNPYNTYRYRGLPPGPISNPGRAALRAAVYPEPNPYWYFLTTPAGEVVYSRTYEEHLAAKFKYLR